MTESEAIEGLGILNNGLNEAFVNADELSEALQMAIQALEKQIQKKPIPIDYGKYIDVIDNARFLRGAYWCPNCKHVVKTGSFCSDCGQKLDWRDENERS
jgi:rRNA maturation endonuclease Nob1